MAAGGSAEEQARRSRGISARLAGRSRFASKKADDWERGAEGERMVAEVLQPLAAGGWRVLHDLPAADGGNIDHVAVGPPGIAVLDAKRWTGSVTLTPDRRLVLAKHDRTGDLDRLQVLVDEVRDLVARDGLKVAVRGYLVLAGDADRERESADLGDLRILGVERVAARLARSRREDLTPELVDAVASTLAGRAAPADRDAPAAGPVAPSPLFERAHRFYYLKPWKKAGHHRLYLSDRHGTRLGWTDVNTGATTVECSGDEARFATALLAAADPTGMKLAPGDLPKVATKLWGGRLLSKVASWHTSVLVGQEWQAFGKQRLYGTLIDPAVTTYGLGWVDLKTGELHPAVEGKLAEDRSPADRYLGYLLHHRPPPTAKR